MREELKHCPVCEATSFEEAVSTVDYSTSKEAFTVQKCTECSHLFTSPRVVEAEIGPYYDNPNYISHTNENKSLFGQVYQVLRGVNLRRKLSYVNAVFTGQGTVLDYGCGTGQFLETLVQSRKKAVGVEINDNARAAAQSFGSVSASIGGVEKGVEVITMWHVLEHIYDLNGLLSSFKERLLPG
ncbi:MAG: class I SAM-dependent methyltransferase, partial [Schleiferiaceae bacterium]